MSSEGVLCEKCWLHVNSFFYLEHAEWHANLEAVLNLMKKDDNEDKESGI